MSDSGPGRPDSQARHTPLAWSAYLLMMIVAGMAIPSQGRVNAELASRTQDPFLAALVSFATGAVIIVAVAYLTKRGRATMRQVGPALRSGQVRWWFMLAGCIGGYFVLTQTLAVGAVGVAVFSVAVVTGQTVGGLLWDRIGLGPAGRKRLDLGRVLGAGLTLLAVIWAVSPQLTVADQGLAWLLLVLLPFSGGFLQAAQQALNGRQTAAYQNPIPGTVFNFVSGSAVLLLIWVFYALVNGVGQALPTTWWYYLGGLFGVIFIALGAVLVARVGVLLAAMGMIAGQLLGSLFLDLVFPAPGSLVTFSTVAGTILTLVAVGVASLPDIRRHRS